MSAARARAGSGRDRTPLTPHAWREAMLGRVERLRQSHAKARSKLEADIESHPLEPQMSGQLMEVMRMEEMAGRQGQHDRKRLLTAKVDSQMQEETRAALSHIIELHKKQRSEVYKKLSSERAKLAKSLHEAAVDVARSQGLALPPAAFACLATASRRRSRGSQGSTHLPRVGSGGHLRAAVDVKGGADTSVRSLTKPLRPTGDFAADEEAHRRQVAEHWADGERFNLRQAFKSQMDRIEADWATYLQEMEQEYHTERARMLGTTVAAVKDSGKSKGKDGHWLAKEKQDTLIHTAPVLAPNTNFQATPGSSKSHGKVSAATRRDLAALDGRFEEAKRQVIVQREEALRWTRRQSERMIAQVGAQDVERRQALAAEAKQEKEFAALVQAVNDVAKRMLMAMANTQAAPAPLATPTDTMRKEVNPASSPGRITPLGHGFGSNGNMRSNDGSPRHSTRSGTRGSRGRTANGHTTNGQRPSSRNGDSRGSNGWSSRHLMNSSVPQQAAAGGVPSSKSTGRLGPGSRRPASGARGSGRTGRGMSSSTRSPSRSPARQGRGAPRSLGRSERTPGRRLPRSSNGHSNGHSGAYSGNSSGRTRTRRRAPIGGGRRTRGADDEALLSTWPSTGLVA